VASLERREVRLVSPYGTLPLGRKRIVMVVKSEVLMKLGGSWIIPLKGILR
jgi:hypothetical protein